MRVAEPVAYDEGISFTHCKQANSFSPNSSYHETNAKVHEQYEVRLQEQGERIKHLEKEVAFLREQLVSATHGRQSRWQCWSTISAQPAP